MTIQSPLDLSREYAIICGDSIEFDAESLLRFVAALKEQYGQSDMFAAYRFKVAEECCERLMSACTDAGCPDDVNMADWIRSIAAPPVAQPLGDDLSELIKQLRTIDAWKDPNTADSVMEEGATALESLQLEHDALRHDVERHIAIGREAEKDAARYQCLTRPDDKHEFIVVGPRGAILTHWLDDALDAVIKEGSKT